ncbi:MAG: class I SAM-dependent methyltransferase [Candidatus Latescibacterota bacterium]
MVPADLTEALKQAYGAKARERDGAMVAPWKLEERARFLAELRQSGSRLLLELGSGPGHDGRFFLEHGLSVVCIDLCPEMVMLCRVKGLEAYEMDVLRLDFPAASFDAVFALNSLLHVPKASIRAVLQGIHRILRPGGLFIQFAAETFDVMYFRRLEPGSRGRTHFQSMILRRAADSPGTPLLAHAGARSATSAP